MRAFRFSVTLPPDLDTEGIRAFARKAEDQGFDVLAAADHLLNVWPPFPSLAVAAAATSRIRLTTLVLNNDLRHPAIVAREAAALSELSGGRFELGIGAGHARPEYDAIGLPFDDAKTRVARLGEALPILRSLLDGEVVSTAGTYYQLHEYRSFPAPASPVPLLAGGNGRVLFRHAARHADIVGFTGLGQTNPDGQTHAARGFAPEAVDERLAVVRQAAGARFAALELNALVQAVVLTGDRDEAAAGLARRIPGLSPATALESPFLLIGEAGEIAGQLHHHRIRWGISYFSTFAHAMDAMAQVIARLR